MRSGQKGNYFRFNINNPATEQTYLKVANDGSIFAELGGRILCGGWMNPTTYSVGNTYCPIFNTRYGPVSRSSTSPFSEAGRGSCSMTIPAS